MKTKDEMYLQQMKEWREANGITFGPPRWDRRCRVCTAALVGKKFLYCSVCGPCVNRKNTLVGQRLQGFKRQEEWKKRNHEKVKSQKRRHWREVRSQAAFKAILIGGLQYEDTSGEVRRMDV